VPDANKNVPERLVWAVEGLDVQSGDHVLEIGGGRGVAAALICRRIGPGRLLAIDRSATATAAATKRNSEHVAAGAAEFRTLALEAADPAQLGSFDKVLAVNVNLFWVRPAQPELELIARLLRPDGRLHLVYDPPGSDNLRRIKEPLLDHLGMAGYRSEAATLPTQSSILLAVTAHAPHRA
jgi:SAM-dependent methyltransferase